MKRRFLKLGPTPGDDFEMQLFVLSQEVTFARLHLGIARQLARETTEKPHLFHAAQTFFGLTFRAHLESAYARAARLFDPAVGTVTIVSMIQAADMKAGKFQFASPPEVRRKITSWNNRKAAIEPALGKLRDLRNSLIAHLDRDVILDATEMARTVAVTFNDIEQILDAAREILSDALASYNSASYGDEFYSANDCEALFRALETSTFIEQLQGNRRSPTHDEIAARAYEIYLQRGKADGNDLEDWFCAERELQRRDA